MLSREIHTLIFDLDNTLIDRNTAMRKTMQAWLCTQPHYTDQDHRVLLDEIMIKDDWGYRNRTDFCNWLLQNHAAKNDDNNCPQRLFAYILQNIVLHVEANGLLQEMLKMLRTKFRLVLATNGNGITQRAKLAQAKLDPFFTADAVFVSGEMGHEKPDVAFFEKVIRELEICPQQALVIGDDLLNDIQTAKRCGLKTAWVSGGREDRHQAAPDITIPTITDLHKWLNTSI